MTRPSSAKKARRIDPPEPKQGTSQTATSSKYVVAIDFGTTYSGAPFAKIEDVESPGNQHDDAIQLHDNWPGQGEAGARAYCKTQTSVFWYMPGSKDRTWEQKRWGWTGYRGYIESLERAGFTSNEMKQLPTIEDHSSQKNSWSRVSPPFMHQLRQKCGYFIKDFKVGVAGASLDLPCGLSLERVISDYLRELPTYIFTELQTRYGSDVKTKRDIKYILTVPAMWTIQERQTMKRCSEMAGMVSKMTGMVGKVNTAASPHDLIIVTEPEAAAVQVHKTLQTARFNNGDQFLVVDVGGGTTDIVLHEKTGSTTRRDIRVKEVSTSVGALVGSINVDKQFFKFFRTKIGCFPWISLKFIDDLKPMRIPLPSKLARDWQQLDLDKKNYLRKNYDYFWISYEDMIQEVFSPVVEQILNLIGGRLAPELVPKLKAILVAGGFSESPYLQDKIQQAFKKETCGTIFMRNAGSAVVRGAVLYGVANEWVDMAREEVPVNCVRKQTFMPLYREGSEDGDDIVVNLYETRAKHPRYVADTRVKKLATCSISVPRKENLGINPELEVSVHFGNVIELSVKGKNFFGEPVKLPPVEMNWTHLA